MNMICADKTTKRRLGVTYVVKTAGTVANFPTSSSMVLAQTEEELHLVCGESSSF